ncbi:DUF3016 domain-containing protein [Arsukibacterium sp.]|uniref:DUF3016 domain-containing protein n=1 Tax=Arsukibacterium sp. TaxID=1977258 RepID=UPI0035635675
MKTFLIALLTLAVSAAVQSSDNAAANVELKFQEMEKFTDIRPANGTRAKFKERVQHNFEAFFQEMASELPAGYHWSITVTDIDLAGDVDYFIGGAGNPIRVIKEIHSPAIKFSHVLLDHEGEEVVSAEEKLRDMGFMQSVRSVNENDPFRYEKQMLTDWFQKEIEPTVNDYAKMQSKVSH